MANRWYTKGAEKVLQAQINLLTDPIKMVCVKNTYAENMDTDEFMSSVVAHEIGDRVALAGRSVTGGKFDADDVVFPAVPAGSTIECFVIFKDTGNDATSPVLMRLDQVTSLPFATSGAAVDPKFDNGTNKIFSMVP